MAYFTILFLIVNIVTAMECPKLQRNEVDWVEFSSAVLEHG